MSEASWAFRAHSVCTWTHKTQVWSYSLCVYLLKGVEEWEVAAKRYLHVRPQLLPGRTSPPTTPTSASVTEADTIGVLGTEYLPQMEGAESKGPNEGPMVWLPQEQLQHQ